MSASPHRPRPGLAISMVVLSAIAFPLMDAIAKMLVEQGVPAVQVAWGRYAANVALLAPVVLFRGGALLPRATPAHLARAVLPAVVSALLFYGFGHMQFAAAAALLFANPLLIVAFSALLLGERVRPARWAAVAAGFAGTLVVLRPGTAVFQWASLAPLGAAFAFAATVLLNRRLAGEADLLATTLHYAVAGTVVLLPGVAWGWAPVTASLALWSCAMALLGGLAMWLITAAYERADASLLAPFHFVELAAAIPIGAGLFGEVPDAATVVGIAVILAAGLVATWHAR